MHIMSANQFEGDVCLVQHHQSVKLEHTEAKVEVDCVFFMGILLRQLLEGFLQYQQPETLRRIVLNAQLSGIADIFMGLFGVYFSVTLQAIRVDCDTLRYEVLGD